MVLLSNRFLVAKQDERGHPMTQYSSIREQMRLLSFVISALALTTKPSLSEPYCLMTSICDRLVIHNAKIYEKLLPITSGTSPSRHPESRKIASTINYASEGRHWYHRHPNWQSSVLISAVALFLEMVRISSTVSPSLASLNTRLLTFSPPQAFITS